LSEDKQLILAANGEIYNHRELRKQFEGITFKLKVTASYFSSYEKDLIL
jgi:asparagine synthetase B (glutamine-hydrolysing)